jgi:ubiquitin-protein ligase E3 C
LNFSSFFLTKWLGRANYVDDLPSLDKELYNGLMFIKNYPGDVADLSLSFSVDDIGILERLIRIELGQAISVDLIPNGRNVAVTNDNKIRYIYLVSHYKVHNSTNPQLNTQIQRQCNAFFQGLSDLIKPKWLKMFSPPEIQILVSGDNTGINIEDMKANVVYNGVYDIEHPTIKLFWTVVEQDLKSEDIVALVRYVTSCSRPPLLGFKELQPLFCIRDSGHDQDRLPSASTCVNLLKLPIYTSRERLREKILYAVYSEAGFDLS